MSGYDEMVERMRFESQRLMDGPAEYLQRLVVAELLSDAADVMEKQAQLVDRLAEECKAWMNGVADVVEPLGYDRSAACGPADLLPGLTDLRNHDMETTRALEEHLQTARYQAERRALQWRRQAHELEETNAEPPNPRGLPPLDPETLAEAQRWYESNGRGMQ